MMTDSLTEFRNLVWQDAGLQRELAEIADDEEFISCVVKAAKTRGYAILDTDIQSALNVARRGYIERKMA